jgi:radical SAM protein with 4Fe4S-binding SPASM domain
LQNVVIGTTGVCNASCIHCPTNKPETAHVARGTMTMPLFKRIVDQLAGPDVSISGPISLGLFGDGLVDPFVVERVKYLRKRLPRARINVNTNGAVYSRHKHKQLTAFDTIVSLHIESLDPDVYSRLMAPLRLDRVLPKWLMLTQDFGRWLNISVPISRANYGEKAAIKSFFRERGVGDVNFTPLMNRCSETSIFADLAFSPHPMTCRSDLLADVIVDWSGDVFACCQDFAKRKQLGDLSRQSLRELLDSPERRAFGALLDAGRWGELPTCANCRYDLGCAETSTGSVLQ